MREGLGLGLLTLLFLIACDGGSVGPGDDDDIVSVLDDDDDDTAPPLEHIPDAWTAPEYDPYDLPDGVPVLHIEIDPDAMARLDADPFAAADERGVFIDGDGVVHDVDLNYRGAYQLLNVINGYGLRNWKVKLDPGDAYLGKREWNLNYEPHFIQKIAMDLMRFAGVPVPGARHVVLHVNGTYQGMYLLYEDPDDKGWLLEQFGHDDGDLYKGAFDIPDQPQCFANLTYLGADSSDYLCHYTKKTNTTVAPDDYTSLVDFVDDLNHLPEQDLSAFFIDDFALDPFRSYLVVSNFIANWDSYPQRPKNYWLYQDLRAERFAFIPWDLDLSFNPHWDDSWNQMGTSCSVLFNLAQSDYTPPHAEEGTDRPLVRRMIVLPGEEQAYIDRYRELSSTILSSAYLHQRLDDLTDLVHPHISDTDRGRLDSYNATLRTFIDQRTASVGSELTTLP